MNSNSILKYVLIDFFCPLKAHGYILVYDITNRESFEHVKYWLSEVKKNGNDEVPKIIVGNKADLDDQRLVTADELASFADDRNIPHMETSAKDGTNVSDMFVHLTTRFLKIADTLPNVASPPTSPSK
jgi:Ras-related protein Rab-1A